MEAEQAPQGSEVQAEQAPKPMPAQRRQGKGRRTDDASGSSRIGLPEPEYLNLGDAYEDIVDGNAEIAPPENVHNVHEGTIVSEPADKVYIQEHTGFRKALRQRFEKSLAERQRQAALMEAGERNDQLAYTTDEAIQTGIVSQNVFRTLAVTLQGLLAGFTIAHCLMVVFDTPPYFSNAHFANHYAPLALPGHCVYYVVLVLCTVAAMDRYDVGQSFPRVLYRAFTFQSGGLAVVFYLGAAVVNQIPIGVDERMALYFRNASLPLESPNLAARERMSVQDQQWMEKDVQIWRGCLIAKAVLVTAAWILVALRPNTDLLVKHLRQTDNEFAQQFRAVGEQSSKHATEKEERTHSVK